MATEVFGRIGESEIYSENPNFYRRKKEYDDIPEKHIKVESTSKPLTEAKKEFLEHLEDESLSVDTCSRINHDWNNK